MKSTSLKLALLAGLGLGFASAVYTPPITAMPVYVGVRVAPPPPRFERVPPPRVGYVWAPGYWRWAGGRHVWAGGYWVRSRPGYRYAPAHWVRNGHGWRFREGHWGR
jgi:hypothetical protein